MRVTRLELDEVRSAVPQFSERDAADSESYPTQNLNDLWDLGVFQAPYPNALGGSDWGLLDCVDATETVAVHSPSTALLLIMPLGLAGVTALSDGAAGAARRRLRAAPLLRRVQLRAWRGRGARGDANRRHAQWRWQLPHYRRQDPLFGRRARRCLLLLGEGLRGRPAGQRHR
jgi:alkylation response protein AidB-like acyl-CoA dehydrogenase